MRNLLKAGMVVGVLLVLFLLFKNFYIQADITLKDDKLNWSVKYKGIENAVDFAVDKQGGFYIAYMDKIQYIDGSGKSYDILKDKNLNIKSLDYKEHKLYFISGSRVISFDLNNKFQKTLLDSLPNYGDYKDSLLRIKGDELYISIGAATNSGVAGSDNQWLKDNPFSYDISAKDITIKGKSFGNEKTGAFVPYRTKNIAGQLIPGHFPGNASIIYYNLTSAAAETYAWGIRNVKGMSFNSEGKLIAAVGGMEDRGLRSVKGDVDYIYEIKKSLWYGWPDYSGGDPLTSPRFKGENNTRVSFILDNHPTTNPPAPMYTHKSISTLGTMDVDSKGIISERDCIYFYDTRDNMIYGLTKAGILSEKAFFKADAKILSLRVASSSIFALDSSQGVLYNINTNNSGEFLNLTRPIVYYLITVMLIGIVIILWKFNFNKEKK
jgi:hypothetical protein